MVGEWLISLVDSCTASDLCEQIATMTASLAEYYEGCASSVTKAEQVPHRLVAMRANCVSGYGQCSGQVSGAVHCSQTVRQQCPKPTSCVTLRCVIEKSGKRRRTTLNVLKIRLIRTAANRPSLLAISETVNPCHRLV